MSKLLPVLVAAAVLGVVALTPHSNEADQVSQAAKAAFIKKCFRDRGGHGSCDAPPEARLPH